MRKRVYTWSVLAAMLLVAPACKDGLELSPEQSLTEKGGFLDGAATQSTLLGVYSSAQLLEVSGALPQVISDYMADNGEFVGSFPTLQEIRDYVTISTNTNIADIWERHYRMILRANLVIDNVPTVVDPAFTDALRKQYIAEAKFMRALGYFQLVNLFGQPFQVSSGNTPGVPLVTASFKGEITFPARNTVSEVHAQIKKDLTEATADLPASYASSINTRGRATKGAAQALLSRLHLYRGEFADAAAAAKLVLDNTQYTPLANYTFFGTKNTTEDVFSIQNSNIDNGRTGTGGWASYHRPAANGGRGDVKLSASLQAAYKEEAGDLRGNLVSAGIGADTKPAVFSTKWSDAVNNADNSPVIRTTEVILNYVEAKAEADGAVSADLITRMNVLRKRAGLALWTATTFADKNAFVTAVLNERRKELALEGHRRMDLLRRGQALRSGLAAAAFGSPKTILPIPQREMDINKGLVQNTGY